MDDSGNDYIKPLAWSQIMHVYFHMQIIGVCVYVCVYVHGGKVATAWVLYYGVECWNNKSKACVKMCEAQNFYAV